jgi:hypothetical protein
MECNLYGIIDLRYTEIITAELLVPETGAFQFKTAVDI